MTAGGVRTRARDGWCPVAEALGSLPPLRHEQSEGQRYFWVNWTPARRGLPSSAETGQQLDWSVRWKRLVLQQDSSRPLSVEPRSQWDCRRWRKHPEKRAVHFQPTGRRTTNSVAVPAAMPAFRC
jgi:hypothetical protein